MLNRRARRVFLALGVLAWGLTSGPPASASLEHEIPMQGFMIWSPNYAACGSGFMYMNGSSTTAHGQAVTWSYQNGCNLTPSPANAGVLASQNHLLLQGSGGTFALCDYGLVATNVQGASIAPVDDFFDACGNGYHREQARWRVNYGGTNYPGSDETTSHYLYE